MDHILRTSATKGLFTQKGFYLLAWIDSQLIALCSSISFFWSSIFSVIPPPRKHSPSELLRVRQFPSEGSKRREHLLIGLFSAINSIALCMLHCVLHWWFLSPQVSYCWTVNESLWQLKSLTHCQESWGNICLSIWEKWDWISQIFCMSSSHQTKGNIRISLVDRTSTEQFAV